MPREWMPITLADTESGSATPIVVVLLLRNLVYGTDLSFEVGRVRTASPAGCSKVNVMRHARFAKRMEAI